MASQGIKPAFSLLLSIVLIGCSGAYVEPTSSTTASPGFVYTGDQGSVYSTTPYGSQYSGDISGFSVDPTTGVLTPLNGFPITINSGANSPLVITHDPQNRFVIAADTELGALHVLAISATTGALTEVPTSPYAISLNPEGVIVDPTGKFVYVSATPSEIVAFNLSNSGILTPVPGGPVPIGLNRGIISGTRINALHMSADGRFLYYATGALMAVYSVDSASGAVTVIQVVTQSIANNEGGFVFDPSGKYLYAMASSSNNVLAYAVDANTGLLTLAHQNTLLVQTVDSSTLTISPNGQFAYTIENGNSLVTYSVANGVFTAVGSPLTGYNARQLLIDPTGSFLYAPQECNTCGPSGASGQINEFAIGSNGGLTPLSPATVPSGSYPYGITMVSQ